MADKEAAAATDGNPNKKQDLQQRVAGKSSDDVKKLTGEYREKDKSPLKTMTPQGKGEIHVISQQASPLKEPKPLSDIAGITESLGSSKVVDTGVAAEKQPTTSGKSSSDDDKKLTEKHKDKDWSPKKTMTPKGKGGKNVIGEIEVIYEQHSQKFKETSQDTCPMKEPESLSAIDDITKSMGSLSVTEKERGMNINEYLQQQAREGKAFKVMVKFIETQDQDIIEGKIHEEYEKQIGYKLPLNKKWGDGLNK